MTGNSSSRSKLAILFETFDFKLVCSLCSLRENDITYKPTSVKHQCIRELLLARAKGTSIWRPISRRPLFPNPGHYELCRFYTEGSGCSKHRRRCTYARSYEEAAVWNVEKRHGLERSAFISLISGSEVVQSNIIQPDTFSSLAELSLAFNLRTVCSVCSVKENEITYTVKRVNHKCSKDMLLAKACGNSKWRPISHRPTGNQRPGPNGRYQVCLFFVEGSGCKRDQQQCTFARSHEEATVWNFEKDQSFDHNVLIKAVSESETEVVQQGNIAENILKEHSGEFLELCEVCFHASPSKITVKKWNNTCSAGTEHTWSPVLVHHFSENGGKEVYNQVRPLPPNCGFDFCSYVQQGKPCWHEPTQCQCAHSEVEMAVWRAEDDGKLIRKDLLLLSQNRLPGPRLHTEIYCKVCLLVLSSQESFFNHCASLEHAQMISEDTTTEWKSRPPPPLGCRADFWLCDRPDTCEYGNNCLKAHSEEELEEWLMRAKEEREIRQSIETQGLLCFNESLLEEYRCSSSEVHIMSEQVDDVIITCDKDLYVELEQINAKLEWNFQVKTERLLAQVALLKQEPGALFSLGDMSPEPCIYSFGQNFQNMDMVYDISVSFKSIYPGLYEQWLVLDFDMRPVLLRKLKVKVGPKLLTNLVKESKFVGPPAENLERWHSGNKFIIPCQNKTEAQEDLLKQYKPHQISLQSKQHTDSQTTLNHQDYKEKMHTFLYNEERAKDRVVSRLHFCGVIALSATLENTQFGMKIAPQGELFCAISVPYTLTPDTSQGYILQRDVRLALIAPVSSVNPSTKVYEATVLRDAISKDNMTDTAGKTADTAQTPRPNYKMHLQLSKRCCSDLKLQSNEKCEMEVQFQLNRLPFCEMHKAIDQLPDTKFVLPDFSNCAVPVCHSKLPVHFNAKQCEAVHYITGDLDVRQCAAPLLIYGPFGTGKTFTLAAAARELRRDPRNKVLICTHTNSSADLYVRDHLHPFFKSGHIEIKAIRIKENKPNAVCATDAITLEYCLRSQDGTMFLPPTKSALDCHRIVIATTSMARQFHNLELPPGYFTHILIDEASQMLECEALMPLGLAGPNTRVILAGDHMQMGPKLFSVDDHQRSSHTLLNRLFYFYQQQKGDAALKSRIIFSENYRSTKEIVDFVSTHFYVGKTDVIKAVGNVPSHPSGQALKFHHVRGECVLDSRTMSWFNFDEVATVVDIVKHLDKDWPSIWGQRDPSSICVLSEGCQVAFIRAELRKIHLGQVNVENIANVQGKQFRVIVITTVQTRDSLLASDSSCLEMFHNACVLNTAMTRAQSQVVVVGDAAALCYFGKCSKVWKTYIDYCSNKDSVAPKHVTKDFIDRDVKEISRLYKTGSLEKDHCQSPSLDSGDNAEDNTDTVLQQMMEEYAMYEEDCLEIWPILEQKRPHRSTNHEKENRLEFYKSQSYTQSQLVTKTTGFSVSSDVYSPNRKEFVCTFEGEDHNRPKIKTDSNFTSKVLIPLSTNIPRIRIQIHKKYPNSVPIWDFSDEQWVLLKFETVDEEFKQNHVFLVKLVCWKEHCTFPLGRVTGILPIGTSLEQGLRILDAEYNISHVRGAYEEISWEDHDTILRENFHHITTFTVDKDTSINLDDAISVRSLTGASYEVGVHIADVAHVVRPDGELDDNAKMCGVTHTLGKRTVPMLPQPLCNQLSLMPNCVRKVISLMMEVEKGTEKIIRHSFKFSLIKSNKRLSYDDVETTIAERHGKEITFSTLDDCVTMAYRFSKAQRKDRLKKDWSYAQPDRDRKPGKRRSHQMIEELMVLFNKYVSELLIGENITSHCTPLRCQAKPNPEMVSDFQEKYGDLIPLSHMRHAISSAKSVVTHRQDSDTRGFCILTSVWNDIQSAAAGTEADMDKIVELVAADDIYPQLLPVIREFRDCAGKAYVIRSNSCIKAKAGHYSLKLSSYTHATAPIRRYMDIILQRLLHAVLGVSPLPYSQQEIDILCQDNEEKIRLEDKYEQKAEMMSFAFNLKKQNASKIAFVVDVDPEGDHFKLSFPFEKHIFPESFPVIYRDLQLEDQPVYDFKEKCMILKWKRRLYSVVDTKIHLAVKKVQNCSPCIEILQSAWKQINEAIDKENWDMVRKLILSTNPRQVSDVKRHAENGEVALRHTENELSGAADEAHYVDLKVQLKGGDTVQIQMTSEIISSYHTPTIQLMCINPKFEICVNHAQNPITCFAKRAVFPARSHYSGANEYLKVWRPICEMESAACAVSESDSIIIEDLEVNFNCNEESRLIGSFDLPLQYVEEWAIECDLAKCFLCIRKRGIKLTSTLEQSKELDPSTFTWVAHGITYKVEEPHKTSSSQAKTVRFNINQLPMNTIPDCVFQNHTTFTVELIPKLLPDVRKENAVNNIVSASGLVQTIAFGKHIPRETAKYVVPRWRIMKKEAPQGLPTLNETQTHAVEKALNNNFTLIQGPPGTGKTVVGVYIVYWFLQLNTEDPRKCEDSKGKDKKEVILYCGPSNKSVDVVAEYLSRLRDSLKPLRVYSQQVEMLEYPYPGSVLQLSVKSLRQEQSKPELRDITLHHRIRQEQNPHSSDIRDFDRRIKLAEQTKEAFTDQEVEDYKTLLKKARRYELQRHDVILCTCTAASSPTLTNTVSARQILIDECAMATEPQTLIPLVCNKPEKIVLLGDHKQLRPIVKDAHAKKLGLSKSLFERYIKVLKTRSVMLDIQYRMHEDICRFPSEAYYENKLKTEVENLNSVLLVDEQPKQIVFGDIRGEEISLVVTTAKGNENSKANRAEKDEVVRIAKLLVQRSKVAQKSIVILSPYNAQVAEIKEELRKNKMADIAVTTITKSQGSEWRYVLLSTVRSLPWEDIVKNPDRDWRSKHLGFVADANQINVGITRAKAGLCIIGNQELLTCCKAWKKLVDHYVSRKAVTEAKKISVRKVVK